MLKKIILSSLITTVFLTSWVYLTKIEALSAVIDQVKGGFSLMLQTFGITTESPAGIFLIIFFWVMFGLVIYLGFYFSEYIYVYLYNKKIERGFANRGAAYNPNEAKDRKIKLERLVIFLKRFLAFSLVIFYFGFIARLITEYHFVIMDKLLYFEVGLIYIDSLLTVKIITLIITLFINFLFSGFFFYLIYETLVEDEQQALYEDHYSNIE